MALVEANRNKKSDSSKWKRNMNKEARKSGKPYVNTAGNDIPSKRVGANCGCSRKCMEPLSAEEADEVLGRFLSLSSKNEQDVFLQNLIKQSTPKKRKLRPDRPGSSRMVITYHILIGARTKEVCRKAFLSLYSISLKRIKRINKLASLGFSPKDMRGKARSVNAKPADVWSKINDHINSFPTKSSHYSGKVITYLDERLDTKKIWKMYNEKHPESKVGLTSFSHYFKENFNLKFGQPQVDCCCECEQLKTKIKNSHISEGAKRNAEADLMIHKRRANKFYSKLKEAKQNPDDTVAALCFDYMQNLSLPKIPVQDTFYLRQINVNVFCVHNVKSNVAKFYTYHEGDGKKGPNEVCTFLLDYLENEIPKTVKILHLFSDNCSGQNKNHALADMLLALVELKRFDKIEQFYPIRGHSFLPCDRDFAQVSRKYKKFDRLYTMRQLTEIIVHSSAKRTKFCVKEVKATDILNFKEWWPVHFKRNPISIETMGKKAEKKNKLQFGIASFHQFTIDSTSPGVIQARPFIDSFMKHTFSMRKATLLHLQIQKAYALGGIPLKQAKIDDVKKLQPYIPENFQDFFEELITWPTTTEDTAE